MSEAEKSYTTGWLLKLSKDTGAPPAVRAFTQAAFQFLVAAMSEAEDKGRTGHVDRAAKAEELLRQLRHTNPEAVQQRIREARKPD